VTDGRTDTQTRDIANSMLSRANKATNAMLIPGIIIIDFIN